MAASAEGTYTPSHPESATTLGTIVELVRHITHADVTSIVSFSITEETITWKAASGFRAHLIDAAHPLVQPIQNKIARRALASESMMILEDVGVAAELPATDFPVHAAEGIRDLAFAPLQARGHTLGALLVGYRSAHQFTEEEKKLLQGLAEMAALALDNARLVESVSVAENIWEQTFNAIGEGILVHDYEMRIVRCNARAAEAMDMQPADVIGLSFTEAFARLFGERAAAYHLTEKADATSSFELQAEDGRRYLISIFPIEQPGGDSVSVVTWNDVTSFSEVQEQLARTRRLASVGQLAAGVAHEINNPLAAITTCAEATMRNMREDRETEALAERNQWNYYQQEIVRQALRCKEITRGLLDLTRQRKAKREACNINAVARQCAKIAVQQAESAAIEFEINLAQDAGEIATDAAMVRQILDNLLRNAIQALGEQPGKITVSTVRIGDRVAIEVGDTGHGIPADVLPRIFDPFFSTKGPGKGYGLGLAICASLAESLSGAVTVESREDAGSRFRLWLPRRAANESKYEASSGG